MSDKVNFLMDRLWTAILDITRVPHSQLEMLMDLPDPTSRRLAVEKLLMGLGKVGARGGHETDG